MTESLLQYFAIKSFKSIVDQKIELGLVNVFIGANGSGKSNILEGLGVLSAAAYGRVNDESLKRRGVRPGVPRLYKSSFPVKHMRPDIFFEAGTQDASYSVSLNNPLEKPRPAWLYKTENLSLKSGGVPFTRSPKTVKNSEQGLAALKLVELEEDDPRTNVLRLLQDFAIYAPNTTLLRGLSEDTQSRDPLGLGGGQLAGAVRELKNVAQKDDFIAEALEDIIDMFGWVHSFDSTGSVESILPNSVARSRLVLRFRDRYMRPKMNTLTAHDASEGVLYVLFCAALALLPNAPKCSAVDNLDHALNPRLVIKLVSLLCKWIIENPKPRQMLFTAHNPAVLDGLPLEDDKVRLFAVDRNSKGHTVVSRVTITDELRRLHREKGWTLSRLWVMGHLGGVPNV